MTSKKTDHAELARTVLGNIQPHEIADAETPNWFAWAQVHASLALVELQRETFEDQKRTNELLMGRMEEVVTIAREGWAAYHQLAASIAQTEAEGN